MIITEVHLLENRVYRGMGSLTKVKVRLIVPRSLCLAQILKLIHIIFMTLSTGSLNVLPNFRRI